jgi:glycosyltransferase involved in cell wall biosynthesis
MRSLGHFDAVVQIGTGYEVAARTRVATFEDLTIPQALELEYPGWERLSAGAIRRRKEMQRRAYVHATACCSSTAWAAESVVADYGIDPSKVHAVGIGRNMEPVAIAGRTWSPASFLFVGIDWELKNGPGVLRAFARLRSEHADARLDIVSAHPPINAPSVYGHGVLRMGIAEEKAQLERLFENATCLVVPSHREAAGIVYLEAAAAGLPVVGSAAGGGRDLIGDGGRVVDPSDDDALLEAMREFSDPSVARRVGTVGLQRAPQFTWRAVAERVARALELPGPRADREADLLELADAG